MARHAPSADKISAALEAHPNETAADIAVAAGVARSTAAKALARLEQEGLAMRRPGRRREGRRLPDRWCVKRPDAEAAREAAKAANRERLAKGGLRALVLDFLVHHPFGPYSPGAIAKDLGRSAGAVSNALAKLAAEGKVIQVAARPRSYQHKV